MGLANIKEMPHPDDRERGTFDFHHYNDHLAIVQGINTLKGTTLTVYALHPVVDHQRFLQMHQAFHDDMAKALSVANTDLSVLDHDDDADRKEWSFRNYQQHLAVRAFLPKI